MLVIFFSISGSSFTFTISDDNFLCLLANNVSFASAFPSSNFLSFIANGVNFAFTISDSWLLSPITNGIGFVSAISDISLFSLIADDSFLLFTTNNMFFSTVSRVLSLSDTLSCLYCLFLKLLAILLASFIY